MIKQWPITNVLPRRLPIPDMERCRVKTREMFSTAINSIKGRGLVALADLKSAREYTLRD